jgi:hypothetical protein
MFKFMLLIKTQYLHISYYYRICSDVILFEAMIKLSVLSSTVRFSKGPIIQRFIDPKYMKMILTAYNDWYLTNTANMFQTKGCLHLKYHFIILLPNLQWCYTVWSHDKVISFEFYMYFICSLNKIKNHYIDYARHIGLISFLDYRDLNFKT